MKSLITILSVIFMMICIVGYGQNQKKIDSLNHVLKTAKYDTTKVNTLLSLANEFYLYNPDTAIIICKDALFRSQKISYKKGSSDSYGWLGYLFNTKGDIHKALECYGKSLETQKEIEDKQGMAISLSNIGQIYCAQGDIPNALEYYGKSLKIKEEIGNKQGIANSYNNIGAIYENQGDIPKALEYFSKSLKIREKIGDKEGMALSLNNIGLIYNNQCNIPMALEYFDKSLKLREEIGDKLGVAVSFSNIGLIFNNQGDIPKALVYFDKSLKLREEIGDKLGLANSYFNIGAIYFKQNNIAEAKRFVEKSYKVSKELGFPKNIKDAAGLLKKVNEKQGDYKKAFEYYQEEILMRDSINNKENFKKTQKQQVKYEYEKRAATDSIAHTKVIEIKNMEVKKQKIVIGFTIFGLLLILVIAIIIFRSLRITRKQKKIIETQKLLVDENNVLLNQQKEEIEVQRDLVTEQKNHIEKIHKEVTDSINYAERIQRSFLATKEILDESLNEYFVFFRPKDVVSGDFYWAGKLSNGDFALATADSTGHGVPGAIMSILNITSLEKAVDQGLFTPSEILNHTRKTIIDRLKKDGSTDGGKDGMDVSLICFDFVNQKLTYSAANNPIWIVRENNLIELRSDKMPVGKHDNDQKSFSNHEFQLQKGDIIYTLTDGMADQFGGTKGKKFMSKNLKNLLIANCQLSMINQKQILEMTITNWIGNGEQIDDITVIGIRI